MDRMLSFLVWGNGKDIEKKSVIWNMVCSILTALQSAVIILIVTRCVGTREAGMMSIAFSVGYLMYTGAGYGVRNFQITDAKERYCFEEYLAARIITCGAALAAAGIYCSFQDYAAEKAFCVIGICFLKLAEAFEDLYHGEIQRLGRLDAAGRLGSARLLMNYAVFFGMLFFGNGFLAAITALAVQSILFVLLEHLLLRSIRHKRHPSRELASGRLILKDCFPLAGGRLILKDCFPLFLMAFFSIYICNAPKYAIDACLTEEAQAYFAVLYMPVFSINLLSGIIYRPQLVAVTKLWDMGERHRFAAVVKRQSLQILGITALVCAAGLTVGIKLLELLYGLPLGQHKAAFAVLLAGGGMAALFNFFCACLTVMRKHSMLTAVSFATALTAALISQKLVMHGALLGAAVLYLLLMAGELLAVTAAILKYLY